MNTSSLLGRTTAGVAAPEEISVAASLTLSGLSLKVSAADASNNYQINSLGVGTAPSGTTGEIRATNNVTAYYSSDSRLKTNISPIQNAVSKIMQIAGVEFDWTDDYIATHGGLDPYFIRKHDVGVIAQQLQQVLPEVVATRADGFLAVKYDRIVALLIEGIKEQQAEIEMLKNRGV